MLLNKTKTTVIHFLCFSTYPWPSILLPNHESLLSKLEHYDSHGLILSWFHSYQTVFSLLSLQSSLKQITVG